MDDMLYRNKDALDITFFDTNTNKYTKKLVNYMKNKFEM